jgi:hypothetical protein
MEKENVIRIKADDLETMVVGYTQVVANSKRKESINPELNEQVKRVIEGLQKRNKDVDAPWMMHRLHRLYSWRTFESINDAEHLKQDLEALNIEVPGFVKNCFQEIEMRTSLLGRYTAGAHLWDQEKQTTERNKIEALAGQYSYDQNSRLAYIDSLFKDAIKEIQELEREAAKKYGYFINGFYEDGNLKAGPEQINELFFYGEMNAGGYQNYYDIALLFKKYTDKHNELGILKSLLGPSTLKNTPVKKELENIFDNPKYWQACRELMIEYDIMDSDGNTLLKDKGHGYLHAIINALRKVGGGKMLKRWSHTDDELREHFSSFLGRSVSKVKRGPYAVMYNAKERDAITYFQECINKK